MKNDIAETGQTKNQASVCPQERLVMRGYWGKIKHRRGIARMVWIGPMTREEMKELDDTYRHNFSENKPDDT